jgi:hypothetical protein
VQGTTNGVAAGNTLPLHLLDVQQPVPWLAMASHGAAVECADRHIHAGRRCTVLRKLISGSRPAVREVQQEAVLLCKV